MISHLEAGEVVIFERRRLQTQENLVQRRQGVLVSVRFPVNLVHNINIRYHCITGKLRLLTEQENFIVKLRRLLF